MIQANELRIGNLVYKVGETSGDIYIADHITILMEHNYIPIPLTPEWLTRAGFVKDETDEYVMNNISIYDFTYMNGRGYELNCHDFPIEIKHVHELQNLVKCLTGFELEFKDL